MNGVLVKLYEIYEDTESVHLVMEFLAGGELFDYITQQESLNEQKAASIVKQIIHSVLYCHKNAICHRDLKPENFMFVSKDKGANLKLIDFGLARSFYAIDEKGIGDYVRMQTQAGTAYFMAPEVIEGNYNNGCDMWAVGTIIYIILSGYPPFDGDSEEEILQ